MAARRSPFDASPFFSGCFRPRGSVARAHAAVAAAAAAARRRAPLPPPRCGRPVRRPRGQFHCGRARAGGRADGVAQRRGCESARRRSLLLACTARRCHRHTRRVTFGGAQSAPAGHPRARHGAVAVRGPQLPFFDFTSYSSLASLPAPLTPHHAPSGPPPRPRSLP